LELNFFDHGNIVDNFTIEWIVLTMHISGLAAFALGMSVRKDTEVEKFK
jgi:hypothetical protein